MSSFALARPKPVLKRLELPFGGACVGASDRLFHPVSTARGARAVHICLKHCPVLKQCRRYAAQYEWLYVVVAGQHWIMRHGELKVSEVPPTREGCLTCAARARTGGDHV